METQKTADAIDLTALKELRAMEPGDADFLKNLIDLFIADMGERVKGMQDAIAKRDAAALKRTAHALKGACGNFGAGKLSALCKKLELIVPETIGQGADLMRQLTAESERVRAALEQAKQATS